MEGIFYFLPKTVECPFDDLAPTALGCFVIFSFIQKWPCIEITSLDLFTMVYKFKL